MSIEKDASNMIEKQKDVAEKKDTQIREIFHRTKNDLQIISSLFELQLMNEEDDSLKEKLLEGFGRFQVMVLVYRGLSYGDGYTEIDFGKFLKQLLENLCASKGLPQVASRAVIDFPELFLNVDTAIPLGLIVNEIFNASLKNISTDNNDVKITISMPPESENEMGLVYRDNGESLGGEFEINNSSPTFGTRLIKGLSQQLSGRTEYLYDKGNVFRVFFRKPES